MKQPLFAIFLLSKLFSLAPENTGNEGISEVQLDPTFNGIRVLDKFQPAILTLFSYATETI